MNDYQKQVNKDHYSFGQYYYPGRWMSYWHEVHEILSVSGAKTVLDVGPGSDLLRSMLKTFEPTIEYSSLDIAKDIQPDLVGSVTSIPAPDNEFDVVCAFQVLEHIEFADFETALKELKRVSKKTVLISLPHFGPQLTLQLKLPFLPRIRCAVKIPFPKKLEFNGQHYWEIGRRGYPVSRIRKVLAKYFYIHKDFVPFENQYHHFFVLEGKKE